MCLNITTEKFVFQLKIELKWSHGQLSYRKLCLNHQRHSLTTKKVGRGVEETTVTFHAMHRDRTKSFKRRSLWCKANALLKFKLPYSKKFTVWKRSYLKLLSWLKTIVNKNNLSTVQANINRLLLLLLTFVSHFK